MAERPNFLVFMTDQEQGAVARPEHPCRTPYAERRDPPTGDGRRSWSRRGRGPPTTAR